MFSLLHILRREEPLLLPHLNESGSFTCEANKRNGVRSWQSISHCLEHPPVKSRSRSLFVSSSTHWMSKGKRYSPLLLLNMIETRCVVTELRLITDRLTGPGHSERGRARTFKEKVPANQRQIIGGLLQVIIVKRLRSVISNNLLSLYRSGVTQAYSQVDL